MKEVSCGYISDIFLVLMVPMALEVSNNNHPEFCKFG